MKITYKHNPARIFRENWRDNNRDNDLAMFEFAESVYEESKREMMSLLDSNTSEANIIKSTKLSLFLMSVTLFAFGRLDVAQDILNNVPYHSVRIKGFSNVLTRLLPTPKNLSVLNNAAEVEQWLKLKYSKLIWHENLGRYLLKNFKILTNIPLNSTTKYFTVTENDSSEYGLILEIFPDIKNNWYACFKSGYSEFSGVYQHPNAEDLIVIANGQGYVVNPENQQLLEAFGGNITEVFEFFDAYIILFQDSSGLISYNETGLIWQNKKLPFGETRKLEIDREILMGEVRISLDRGWEDFWLSAKTGEIHFKKYDRVNDIIEHSKNKNPPWWFPFYW